MKNSFWLLPLSSVAGMLIATPSQASLVQDTSLASACQGEVPVVVHDGMGMSLDFTQTSYVVQRAWLGDPSKVTLDSDRPLEQGSSVIFLRAISGLNFDGLPSTATTILTTVLSGTDGSKVCQFPISYASGQPSYTSLRFNNGDTVSQPSAGGQEDSQQIVDINNVQAGINANAIALGQENPVVIRVNQFIEKVRGGQSQRSAAQELGIEWPLIVELNRQGAETSPTASDVVYL
jgi:hypothetical protein